MKNGGKNKQKCCVYNFVKCVYVYSLLKNKANAFNKNQVKTVKNMTE